MSSSAPQGIDARVEPPAERRGRLSPIRKGTPVAAADGAANEVMPWILWHFWAVLALLLALRLALGAWMELTPDEAVYWSWSRHLSGGYLDHPPLIAWINWLFTKAMGSTELAVRLPAAFMALGSVAVIVQLARRLMPARTAGDVAWMWLLNPLLAGIATISTPDTPAMLFSTLALACVLLLFHRQVDEPPDGGCPGVGRQATDSPASFGLWLLFGLFCGLALLAKYTSLLLPVGVVAALMMTRGGRVHFRRPGVYLAAVIALAVFSPVLWWNWHHEWVSFLFQLHHGTGSDAAQPVSLLKLLMHAAAYVGGQAIMWTPILFGVLVVVLAGGWRAWRRLALVDLVLLMSATLPLVLFAAASLRKLGEINWPMFAYVPGSLLIGRFLARQRSGALEKWVWEGCKVALSFTLVLHLLVAPGTPRLMARLHLHVPHNLLDVTDRWRRFGTALAQASGGLPVVCNRHQEAAEASFYMPGQPEVWCDSVGSRPTAFDYFVPQPDYERIARLIFVGGHAVQFAEKHGYHHCQTVALKTADADGQGSRLAQVMWR